VTERLAPGVPDDYYRHLREVEDRHWWFGGMREISARLLGRRLRGGGAVLDAGCGTGGYLRWLLDHGSFSHAAGADLAAAAVELARDRVPEADLHVASLASLPFESERFDLVVSNDVLQHVDEGEVDRSLAELRRVLKPGGTLLLRTNGARRLRRERSDWRAYDASTLRHELERAGFAVERVTHANAIASLWSRIRLRTAHAPSEETHGIPSGAAGGRAVVGALLLRAEAGLLSLPGTTVPYGDTLFALASSSTRSPVRPDS
jgi:SAM-dependent methyltransferase